MIYSPIVFAFLSAALIYFKSNKANKVITNAIEKFSDSSESKYTEYEKNHSRIADVAVGSIMFNTKAGTLFPGP